MFDAAYQNPSETRLAAVTALEIGPDAYAVIAQCITGETFIHNANAEDFLTEEEAMLVAHRATMDGVIHASDFIGMGG